MMSWHPWSRHEQLAARDIVGLGGYLEGDLVLPSGEIVDLVAAIPRHCDYCGYAGRIHSLADGAC